MVKAKLTHEVFRPLRVYAGFDWNDDWYLRANRHDTDDRLFYYEKRLTGSIRFDLKHVGSEVDGGYAFDRVYFEGDKYKNATRTESTSTTDRSSSGRSACGSELGRRRR
jgi:hypothetical protein